MRWAVPLAAVVALAVPVEGGLRITTLEVLDEPLAPDLAASEAVVVLGEADCASALARAQGTGGATIQVFAQGPRLILAGTGDHLVPTDTCGLGGTAVPFRIPLAAAVVRAAPAMEPQEGSVRVQFRPNAAEGADPATAEAGFTLRSRPLVVPQVTFASRFATVLDQPVTFNATVANLGNAPFAVTGRGAITGVVGEDAGATAPVEVWGAEVVRNGTARITITVGAPPGRWDNAHAMGELTVTSLVEPAGEPRVVPFDFLLTKMRPERKESPGPALPLALVALAVLAARRRV